MKKSRFSYRIDEEEYPAIIGFIPSIVKNERWTPIVYFCLDSELCIGGRSAGFTEILQVGFLNKRIKIRQTSRFLTIYQDYPENIDDDVFSRTGTVFLRKEKKISPGVIYGTNKLISGVWQSNEGKIWLASYVEGDCGSFSPPEEDPEKELIYEL